jgi:hypothetical protein
MDVTHSKTIGDSLNCILDPSIRHRIILGIRGSLLFFIGEVKYNFGIFGVSSRRFKIGFVVKAFRLKAPSLCKEDAFKIRFLAYEPAFGFRRLTDNRSKN